MAHPARGQPKPDPQYFDDLPPPTTCDILVWAGAETGIAGRIRKTGKTGWNIPSSRCQVLNYWRLSRPEGTFSFVC